jgi:hypothetical protein
MEDKLCRSGKSYLPIPRGNLFFPKAYCAPWKAKQRLPGCIIKLLRARILGPDEHRNRLVLTQITARFSFRFLNRGKPLLPI